MSERDELAREIFAVDNQNAEDVEAEWERANDHSTDYGPSADYAYAIADGLIAAGYRKAPHD